MESYISIRCYAGSHTSPLRNGYQLGIDRGTWPCPWNIWNQSYLSSTVMACDGMWRGLWNDKTSRWIPDTVTYWMYCLERTARLLSESSLEHMVPRILILCRSYSIFRCRIDDYMSLKTARETIGPFSHWHNPSSNVSCKLTPVSLPKRLSETKLWHMLSPATCNFQTKKEELLGFISKSLNFKWNTLLLISRIFLVLTWPLRYFLMLRTGDQPSWICAELQNKASKGSMICLLGPIFSCHINKPSISLHSHTCWVTFEALEDLPNCCPLHKVS